MSVVHAPGCSASECAARYKIAPYEAHFSCPGCQRLVGWCLGAGDDMPELCDDCWLDVTRAREFAAKECEGRR